MVKINCGVDSCSHNKAGVCYANCIDIVGGAAVKSQDTCCGSFLNKLHYSELTNNVLGPGQCDCLRCTVEACAYNDNRLCTLEMIQVNGCHAEYHTQTECTSFKSGK